MSSDESENLGSDIGSQLVTEPKAMLVSAAILLGFAMIPGFPTLVFLGLAAVVGFGGYYITRKRRNAGTAADNNRMPALAAAVAPAGQSPRFPDEEDDTRPVEPVTFALTVPLMVDIAATVRNAIKPDRLDREVARVRRALYFDLGVPFPGIHLRLNENLPDGHYRIMVNEVPVAAGSARADYVIVRESEANLKMFDIPYEKGEDFLPNTPSLWVQTKHIASSTRRASRR